MAARAYEEGLTLSSMGRHLEAIQCFEQALAERPQDCRVLFALGNTARSLGLNGPAESFFRQVLALEPDRLEAQVNLANLLRAHGQFDAAKALLSPALSRNPASPELHLTLASVAREQGDLDTAANGYRAALAINPDYVPALANLADLLTDDGEFEAARTLYDRALKFEPGNAQARLNRAILHLLRGDLRNGWRDYAARVSVPGKVPVCELRYVPWTGGHMRKTRLLVRAEQGIGDQIMFASTLPGLSDRAAEDGGSVVLECEPRLVRLFQRSFPRCTVHPASFKPGSGAVTADYDWLRNAGGANAAILMGSLPRYLRGSLDAFPNPHAYLKPDTEELGRWRTRFAALGQGPRIGICWRSGKAGGHRAVQFAPLEIWGRFLQDLPGAVVCTQYDATPNEIAALETISGRRVFVPPGLDQKNELDRTAAMLSALDAVVSAPTAVSWLAAGAGVPTLKLLYDTSWTSFGQTYEPFAPSCACISPKSRGDWTNVFEQAATLLVARPGR